MEKILVTYSKTFNEEQKTTLDVVKKVLKKRKIKALFCERTALSDVYFMDCSLIVTVGGDGTYLKAAQFIRDDALIFGVNSDLENKEGYYTSSSRYDFEKKFRLIQRGEHKIKKLQRLKAEINNKIVKEPALNEFYFGAYNAYLTSRYVIEFKKHKERQRSSGVLVATPTGTEAWASASHGKKIKKQNNFVFVVREPYEGKVFSKYKLKHGIMGKNDLIKLKSEMDKGILVADSISREYMMNYGDVVVISPSNKYLNAVRF